MFTINLTNLYYFNYYSWKYSGVLIKKAMDRSSVGLDS